MSSNATSYLKKHAAGRCQSCPYPAEPGRWYCVVCLTRNAEKARRKRLELIRAGLCGRGCGRPLAPGHTRCGVCLVKLRGWRTVTEG